MDKNGSKQTSQSRREFLKKAAYIPPTIATISVTPSVFAAGSAYSNPNSNQVIQKPGRPNSVPTTNKGRHRGRTW